MNLTKMMKLCKKNAFCEILTAKSRDRYLSNGRMLARLEPGTEFTSTDALAFMEVTEEKLDGFQHGDRNINEDYEFSGFMNEEYEQVERLPVNLKIGRNEYIPYVTAQGLMLIDRKYYDVLDYGEAHSCYYGRFGNSDVLIVPGSGGVVEGVIFPHEVDTDSFYTITGCIYAAAEKANRNKFCDCGHHQMTLEV